MRKFVLAALALAAPALAQNNDPPPIDVDVVGGINERIAIANYERTIRTYRRLLINAAGR